jgi:hypothetical protein
MLVGCNTRNSTPEVTAFGAKATATETQHKNSLCRGALTGEGAEHGRRCASFLALCNGLGAGSGKALKQRYDPPDLAGGGG